MRSAPQTRMQDARGSRGAREVLAIRPPWTRAYRRAWLVRDIVAGLTLVAVAAPEQMATAKLTGMPPQAGLLTFVIGTVIFALVGSHALLSVGADSTISPVLAAGAVAASVAPDGRAAAVGVISVLVGIVVIGFGVGRLGWLARFLSIPVMLGLLAGISVVIVVHQLPSALGLPAASGGIPERIGQLVHHFGSVDGRVVALAAGVLATTVGAERINPRIPGALIGVGLATMVVAAAQLSRHGVQVVGSVGHGVHVVDPRQWVQVVDGQMLAPVLIASVLCVAQIATTEHAVPDQHAVLDRDLIGVGLGSMVAALSGGFAVNASPPRTAVVQDAGARTQIAGITAAGGLLVLALWGGTVLALIPEAALAGILFFVASRLVRPAQWRRVWMFDRREFLIGLLTAVTVVLWGIEVGMLVALIVTLADHIRRQARPTDALLGQIPGTDHWVPVDAIPGARQVPGVLVYLLYAPLWYADADFVLHRIESVIRSASEPVALLVFDAAAVADVDYTGAQALRTLITRVTSEGVTVAIARASRSVDANLRHEVLTDILGADRVFSDVASAVQSLGPSSGTTSFASGPAAGSQV